MSHQQCLAGGTRTCIHTPGDPLELSELQPRFDDILSGTALVYFDGRLTEAAVSLAKAARNAGLLRGQSSWELAAATGVVGKSLSRVASIEL